MNGSYENFPTQLRWLCMHGFPLKSIPVELRMDSLVAPDLSYSKIESFDVCYTNPSQPKKKQKLDGSCSKEKKLLGSLKILDLSFCEQLRSVGGFDGLHALERVILTNSIHFLEVCESIEQCAELCLLDLSYCKTLKKLPRTIRMLKKVKTLLLGCCNLGESQTKISDMDSVILEAIPNDQKFFMISLLRSLVSLSFENANLSNESFPMDFSCLSMLKELYLDENPIVSLPNCARNLRRLVILSMKNCKLLMSIDPPYTQAFLDIYSNSEHKPLLQKVSFVPEMSPLELLLGGGNSLAPSSFEIEGMEMEGGDKVTISLTEGLDKVTKECGVSFVYGDGKRDEEEDVLGSYKSWNHIIGGDLTGFELTTGEYILHNERFLVHGTEVNLYHLPLVGDGASFKG
ncbi:unnamed protein product [Lactuca saligna]|uniref:Disease resistance protein RPS4B/Roq1-like leucine-rich repeats domain-containing protein n=1 Tax=Lactuca saligna TaxID=75948 RepID=A0AA35VHR5_LACSI|nr:unnamed protein product [Lactuca saligna]CAI9268959.1 unnamed protein product [Lactuca saligna]